VNAFHVCGAILAIWALVVSFLGVTREGFPGPAERVVGAISVVLVLLAIGAAIYTGATEEEEEEGEGEEAALVLPR
jgi:formate-dependent nitrite reductase membrane component NrfD